ncbi:ferritin-like domain-containing protein [Jeongeupia naejangsanensis]|uniref:Ferritin-like protein n=1 Tax=Jeongeupia naejangsanensis TaxID=613195 RepID=A0ABS2BGY0_9NEIS|nr:ferritin-like protein [Jeongeupia naejangsanensis]MBM3114868.1 ferritin-like protein [Jeongeupia naejangsanensis]
MLSIRQNIIDQLLKGCSLEELKKAANTAVELELSTIPPYLTGLFSVMPGSNQRAAALVQSIVTEEMLHMTLAANLLIAIGGNPDIVAIGRSLSYPTPLPDKIDDDLQVGLAALTKRQLKNVFMAIERPETKPGEILPGEDVPQPTPVVPGEFGSIGQFYKALLTALTIADASNPELFANPRLEQQLDISKWFPPVRTAPAEGKIRNLDDAALAINTIVAQGEGIQTGSGSHANEEGLYQEGRSRKAHLNESILPRHHQGGKKVVSTNEIHPGDGDGSYAHYFKFGEIFHGRELMPDLEAVSGWSYNGAPVQLDESQIYNFLPNAAVSDYIPGSAASIAAQRFYDAYQMLLTSLDQVFNGKPAAMDKALGLMYQLKLQAHQVAQCPVGGNASNLVAAPPFMLTH